MLKRLESNKIRSGFKGPIKTVLVPVSFGISSICLLHVLDQQLRFRKEQGRHAGYYLHLLFVDQYPILNEPFPQNIKESVMQRYSSHVYSVISLEEHADRPARFDDSVNEKRKTFREKVRSLSSVSAKSDFIEITRRQVILAFAKTSGCDAIFFGDSTTRLAEKTLSETAKGRGMSLPWLTFDGNFLGVNCVYPLRDLLRKELIAYANVASPPLISLISKSPPQVATTSKDTSIDALMTQYFESVESDYPSIVANVVRTTGKLKPASIVSCNGRCSLCEYPMVPGSSGGEQGSAALSRADSTNGIEQSQPLCHGCKTTLEGG